jgi:N utilization substance protein B
MTGHVMRRARCLALEALYEADSSDHEVGAVLERRLVEAQSDDPKVATGKALELVQQALRGVTGRKGEIDAYIQEAAPRFPVESMAVVDRNILRLAIWELLSDNSAPVAAVVNEAVELAHRYGGDSSPAFVNGVLRTVSTRIRAAHTAVGAPPEELASIPPQSQEN